MKSVVIGIGNTLFKDDGIGVYTAHYLNKNYLFSPYLEIIDGGTLGLNLIEYLHSFDNVILLDTLSINTLPGEIYRIPAEEFHGLGSFRSTAHEVEVVQMLEASQLYGIDTNVVVIGIVPDDITSVSIGLTSAVEKHFQQYLELVLDEIRSLGIKETQMDALPLKAVVKELMGSDNG